MKVLRFVFLTLFVVGALFYLNALIPQKSSEAKVYPSDIVNTDDGMMKIHPVESVGANGSSYAVDFQLISLTGHTLHTTVVTHNFFCPNLSPDGKCYSNGTERTQTIDVPADHYVDAWSDKATPDMAHVSGFSDCGLYQIDLNLSYPGAHNTATYQAAGGMDTGKVCKTPVITPTATPTPPAQHHLACVNNACMSVDGAGTNSCTTNPNSCAPVTTHLTVVKVVNNNHGGTKGPNDFTLRVNGTQVTNSVSNTENPGDYTVSEDSMDGYHQVSISGSCDNNGHVHLNAGDNATCIIENEDNG